MLVPEPTKQSSEAAKLDLLILEPGVQSTVGHRGRCLAAIKRVCCLMRASSAGLPWPAD